MPRHSDKQIELLLDAYKSLLHELHKLQVEEEVLMHRFYEFWSAQGLTTENAGAKYVAVDGENGHAKKMD